LMTITGSPDGVSRSEISRPATSVMPSAFK
jgi:hypothetical protein